MQEKYKVIISDRARQMMVTHISFLAKVNKNAARNTKDNLISAIKLLKTMPHRFPFFEEEYIPRNKYHKMYVENWYLVIFQIKDSTVYVDYILDCRKDYSWLIK